ncbi:hypothetical protein NDU88_000107 [Pleurodeles waltl]|uniref:Very-long-chain 3-oxoacyl-CoA synthase n=1 Tax=Pleurodeles waltl TaxID=8319 RepID=A0AAV7PZT5_PLEWA|nr:hypothetical protein NDU88_000107 [Pleurodeles waltl]
MHHCWHYAALVTTRLLHWYASLLALRSTCYYASLLALRSTPVTMYHCWHYAALVTTRLLHWYASLLAVRSTCYYVSLLALRSTPVTMYHCWHYAALVTTRLLHWYASLLALRSTCYYASLLALRSTPVTMYHCWHYAALLLVRLLCVRTGGSDYTSVSLFKCTTANPIKGSKALHYPRPPHLTAHAPVACEYSTYISWPLSLLLRSQISTSPLTEGARAIERYLMVSFPLMIAGLSEALYHNLVFGTWRYLPADIRSGRVPTLWPLCTPEDTRYKGRMQGLQKDTWGLVVQGKDTESAEGYMGSKETWTPEDTRYKGRIQGLQKDTWGLVVQGKDTESAEGYMGSRDQAHLRIPGTQEGYRVCRRIQGFQGDCTPEGTREGYRVCRRIHGVLWYKGRIQGLQKGTWGHSIQFTQEGYRVYGRIQGLQGDSAHLRIQGTREGCRFYRRIHGIKGDLDT